MWLGKNATLHVVDIVTNFNGASILSNQTIEEPWDALVSFWASLYIGVSAQNAFGSRKCIYFSKVGKPH